jgi:hypothetical protein
MESDNARIDGSEANKIGANISSNEGSIFNFIYDTKN